MTTAYKFLEPYTFKNGMTVKNRVVIPPMTEASSFEEGSITTDELRYF
nr:NADH-dependent flavin oxidoreductase [Oenococcus oeni]